jgi:WD40 repeat protein
MKKILLTLLAVACFAMAHAREPKLVWKNKYDVNFFTTRETGFSSDSKYFAIGANNGDIAIYEAATGAVYNTHSLHSSQVFCSIFQPGGTLLASGDKSGHLVIYDYVEKKHTHIIDAHSGALTAMAFSKDGMLVTGSRDNSIKVWDPNTGKMLSEITGITGNIISVRITNDGKTIVAGTSALSKGLRLIDIETQTEVRVFESANLQNLDLSPDNKYVATANLKRNVFVWDITKYKVAYELEGHSKNLSDVAFNPKGGMLASSSNDRTVILWDLAQKKSSAIITGKKTMAGLAFSPDGKYLATTNEDGTLSIWDVSELSL